MNVFSTLYSFLFLIKYCERTHLKRQKIIGQTMGIQNIKIWTVILWNVILQKVTNCILLTIISWKIKIHEP